MTTEEMIVILQAYARGEPIQSRQLNSAAGWIDCKPVGGEFNPNFGYAEFRIKPREPMEGYICVEVGVNKFFPSREHAQDFADSHKGKYRVAKVREVIE